MNAYEAAYDCLSKLEFPVSPDEYDGESDTYITYNYNTDRGESFADNKPDVNRVSLYVHFVCPYDRNHLEDKKRIRNALHAYGFSYPEIVEANVKEHNLRHVIFDTEWIESI